MSFVRLGSRRGRRGNAAAIGLINLSHNLARYEQIVRLKLLLSEPEATNRCLKSED